MIIAKNNFLKKTFLFLIWTNFSISCQTGSDMVQEADLEESQFLNENQSYPNQQENQIKESNLSNQQEISQNNSEENLQSIFGEFESDQNLDSNFNPEFSQAVDNDQNLTLEQNSAEQIRPLQENVTVQQILAEQTPPQIKQHHEQSIEWIGMDYDQQRRSIRVEILTEGEPEYTIQRQPGIKVLEIIKINFPNTKLRPRLKYPLDSSEFHGPVAYIQAKNSSQGANVFIYLRQSGLNSSVFAHDGNLLIEFPIPKNYLGVENSPPSENSLILKAEILTPSPTPNLSLLSGSQIPLGYTPEKSIKSNPPKYSTTKKILNSEINQPATKLSALEDNIPPTEVEYRPLESGQAQNSQPIQSDSNGTNSTNSSTQEEMSREEPLNQTSPNTNPARNLNNPQALYLNKKEQLKKTSHQNQFIPVFQVSQDQFDFEQNQFENDLFNQQQGNDNIFGDLYQNDNDLFNNQLNQELFENQNIDNNQNTSTNLNSEQSTEDENTPNQVEIQAENQSEIDEYQNDLTPSSGKIAVKSKSILSQPVSLEFRGASIRDVMKALSEQNAVNFVFSDSIGNKKVTLSFKNVSWNEALQAVLETSGLGMIKLDGNVIRLDEIEVLEKEKINLEKARESASHLIDTKVMVIRLSYARAPNVLQVVSTMIEPYKHDKRTRVSADQRTNSIIVEAIPAALEKIKALVQRVDLQTPQVKIDTKIVEVLNNENLNLGINWAAPLRLDAGRGMGFGNVPFANSMQAGFSIDTGIDPASLSNTSAIDLHFGSMNNLFELDMRLRMAESQSIVKSLQNNSVIVIDNQTAKVEVGRVVHTVTSTLGASGDSSSSGVTETKYALMVEVTPHITADGAIQMGVKIENSDMVEGTRDIPDKNERKVQTLLLRENGQTAVINGVYMTNYNKTTQGVPLLSKIPILGALFRRQSYTENKRELLIMITPTIVNRTKAFDKDSNLATTINSQNSVQTYENANQMDQNSNQQILNNNQENLQNTQNQYQVENNTNNQYQSQNQDENLEQQQDENQEQYQDNQYQEENQNQSLQDNQTDQNSNNLQNNQS